MNTITGIPSDFSNRIRIRVRACTPSTAEMTSTAPSSTRNARSTSPTKSGPVVQTRETQFRYIVRETGALVYYHLTHGSSDFSDPGLG